MSQENCLSKKFEVLRYSPSALQYCTFLSQLSKQKKYRLCTNAVWYLRLLITHLLVFIVLMPFFFCIIIIILFIITHLFGLNLQPV